MDVALEYLDNWKLDQVYADNFPPEFQARDYWARQYLSILVLWIIGGWVMYLSIAGKYDSLNAIDRILRFKLHIYF